MKTTLKIILILVFQIAVISATVKLTVNYCTAKFGHVQFGKADEGFQVFEARVPVYDERGELSSMVYADKMTVDFGKPADLTKPHILQFEKGKVSVEIKGDFGQILFDSGGAKTLKVWGNTKIKCYKNPFEDE